MLTVSYERGPADEPPPPCWWREAAEFLGCSIWREQRDAYRDRDEDWRALRQIIRWVEQGEVGRLLVPSPAHLHAEVDDAELEAGEVEPTYRAWRGQVILHEFRRRGCEVYSASGLRKALVYTGHWPKEKERWGRVFMCLTAGSESGLFDEIEWFGRVVAPPRPVAPPPATPPPPSPVARGKARQKAGRKPFGDDETLRRMTDLRGEGKSDTEIAAALNGEGRKSPTGKGFTPKLVWYYLSSRNTGR